MQVSRPQLVKLLSAFSPAVVANAGDIVGQGIQPHISHMLRVKTYRNPPGKGGPGHAQILKPGKQEIIHHLILPGNRLDELRVFVNVADQPVRVFAHLKEIRFLLGRLHRPAAVRTLSVHKLGLCKK